MVGSPPVRVLVTRPEPGASRTAALLRERGYFPVSLPLTEIRGVPATVPDRSFDAVAVTSANAPRLAASELVDKVRNAPCFAVGAQTAAACRAVGLAHVVEAGGTAEALADRLARETHTSASILYLCGSPRKPILEASLQALGRLVEAVEVYRTERLTLTTAQRALLVKEPFNAILVYSAESAQALMDVLCDLPPAVWSEAAFLCLSEDIASFLPPAPRTIVAAQPMEPDLLHALTMLHPARSG